MRSVVRHFGDVRAVDGVSFELPRGEIMALLGPNGAGKTTTVEMCEGFSAPDGGEIRVLGQDPMVRTDALRSRIGVMLQGGGAYPGSRAGEMLALVASYAADPVDPSWLLEKLGLAGAVRTPYRRLSGGQQQRLALACALVGRPELVFLDEPTAGLDAQARHLVWELISALRRDGVSVVLTTHAMEEAEELADRVVILDRGRVVANGTPLELTSRGAQGQLRFSASAGLDVDLLADALPEGYKPTEAYPGHYLVEGAIDPQVIATVTSWCARHNVLATDLRVEQRSLEDVFLDLTGRELRG